MYMPIKSILVADENTQSIKMPILQFELLRS